MSAYLFHYFFFPMFFFWILSEIRLLFFSRKDPQDLVNSILFNNVFFPLNVILFENSMHTALNAPNTHSSNDSAHGPSSLLYSSIQPLNIKMFQPITPSEKSISEFYTQYKPGQTPSKDDIEVSSKVTPSHKATTNESYSIDKYYYPDNSGTLAC